MKKYAVITMDVEDWYHTYFPEMDVDRSQSLLDGLDVALEIMDQKDIKGSFFVVGEIADMLAEKLQKMDANGHDIACHNWVHLRPVTMGIDEYKDQLIKASTMSIDTLTWHLGLVLTCVGAAYLANMGLKALLPSISFPTYGLALIFSIGLQTILRALKMDGYVDKKTITHIGSSATDFLVGFGVASINISVVLQYWVPIVLLVAVGLAVVLLFLLFISRKFFSNYWFERGIYIYGMSTGVLATGAILLRIADPEFKTGVLEDFGFAWIFMSIVDMLLVSFCPMFIISGVGAVSGVILIAVAAACLVACKMMKKANN